MSSGATGYVAYGVVLEEGDEFPWEDDFDDWWDRVGPEAECPVVLEYAGNCEYPTWVLCAAGTVQQGGYGEKLKKLPKVGAAALVAFCRKYRIKTGRRKPAWILFANYG